MGPDDVNDPKERKKMPLIDDIGLHKRYGHDDGAEGRISDVQITKRVKNFRAKKGSRSKRKWHFLQEGGLEPDDSFCFWALAGQCTEISA